MRVTMQMTQDKVTATDTKSYPHRLTVEVVGAFQEVQEAEKRIDSALKSTRPNDAKKLADSIEDVIADIATRDNGRVFWEMVNDSEKAPVTMGDLRKILTLIHEATPPKQSEMSD